MLKFDSSAQHFVVTPAFGRVEGTCHLRVQARPIQRHPECVQEAGPIQAGGVRGSVQLSSYRIRLGIWSVTSVTQRLIFLLNAYTNGCMLVL